MLMVGRHGLRDSQVPGLDRTGWPPVRRAGPFDHLVKGEREEAEFGQSLVWKCRAMKCQAGIPTRPKRGALDR